MKRYPIKIVWDFDESEYIVFIEGISGIEGRGPTEQEAIEDFNENYDKALK